MTADALDFSARRVVVTGAGGAIGGAIGELLLSRGAVVLAADVNEDAVARMAAAGAEVVGCDLASAEGRAKLLRVAGRCDHLVLAHGIVRPKSIAETTEDDWDAIIDVNAKAVYFLCREFGPLLIDGGSIVTLSSVSARSAASQEQSVYCASKAAVGSITRSFAYAYASRGIRVNALLPGIVDTPMQQQFLDAAARARGTTPEALDAARLKLVPLGRAATPQECAEVALWLLSPAASYLTGQQVAADGGLTMV
jgi:NAD(P)-dependent dehydrogenase (short-subunit alcohol dehydrogenase family)